MGRGNTLPTIWAIPDDLWEQIRPVNLEMDPPKSAGRKRVHPRRILDGIIFRMRSGCQWNPSPSGTGGRQHDTQDLPALGGAWCAGTHLGRVGRGMRGTGRRGLGVAVCGLRHGESPF